MGGRESVMTQNENLLMAVLNSSPVTDGQIEDRLAGTPGATLARQLGGTGSDRELSQLRRTRDALHSLVRRDASVLSELTHVLGGAVHTPRMTTDGVVWELQAPDDDRLSVLTVLAWSEVNLQLPGRLRPCANDECNLFLVDHSRPGTARWCSMATCGNRMKARAYASRSRV